MTKLVSELMKPPTRVWRSLCITVSAMLVATSPALAQPAASVDIFFREGMALKNHRNYRAAADKFEQILRLAPATAGGAEYHLAECYEQTGKLALAWWHYQRVALLASARGKVPQAQLAQQHAENVRKRIGMLAVRVSSVAMGISGLKVQLDDWWMDREQWNHPVPLDPGEHVAIVSAPGKRRWQGKVVVVAGAAPIELVVPPLENELAPPSTTPSAVTTEAERPWRALPSKVPDTDTHSLQAPSGEGSSIGFDPRVGTLLAGLVGVAGLVVGTGLAVHAKSLSSEDAATTTKVFSGLCFIGGIASASAALYLWVSAPPAQKPTPTATWSIAPYAALHGGGTLVRYTF